MSNYLKGLLAIGFLSMSIDAQAEPILTTVSCDSTGLYICLTSVQYFQVGDELYNVSFVPANIVDAFDVDRTGNILEQFKPLKTALFWDDREGAHTFAVALAGLLTANDIDGFLCYAQCDDSSAGLPYGYTYIPVYLQTTTNLEVASCFVGTVSSTGQGLHYCFFNPGSNVQNWAVISRAPEPATVVTFGLGLLLLSLVRRKLHPATQR